MHDIKNIEALGIPSVAIATTEFVTAATAQNAALGYDSAVIFVSHPIQDRSNAELRALADAVLGDVLAALTHAA